MRKIIPFTIVGAVTMTTLLSTVSHAGTLTLNQGETLFFPSGENNQKTTCTTGYVNHSNHTVLTAGDCGKKGDKVFVVGEQVVGEIMHISDYGIITIKLDDAVNAGENIYSGDKILGPRDVEPHQELRGYGAISNEKSTEILNFGKDHILSTTMKMSESDSGGPLYVPDQGILGLMVPERNLSEIHPDADDNPERTLSVILEEHTLSYRMENKEEKVEFWGRIVSFFRTLFTR